jgi:hypothetical protein
MKVGWIRPRILTPDHTNLWLKAPSVAAAQAVLILLDPERPDEYWLLENRNKSGSEASVVESGLPTEGLAVWWVRTRALADKTDNIRLVAASATDQDPDGDGIYGKAGKNNQGEWHAADWPINRDNPGYYWYPDSNSGVQDLFTEQSGPRTLYYSDGTPSKFGLYCISAPGETVTLWVGNKLPPSVLVPSLFMLLGR